MHVGVPVVPVSTPYARVSQDFGKLRYIFDLIKPGMIYVDEADRYAKALEAIGAVPRVEVVASRGSLGATRVTPFSTLTEVRPTPAVDAAFASVGPDTLAKILFTSGSTGQPKGVINTQRMMCANQESAAAAWTILNDHPPVIVDWLPWNHTFGANHNFNMMLRNGGTLYIDEGKPVPALIGRTIANLRDVSPTRVLQRAARLCGAARSPGEGRGAAAEILRAARPDALCGGGVAAVAVGPAGAAGREGARQQGAVRCLLGHDRDGAGRHHGAFPHGPARQHRRAGARHAGEAGAGRGQAGDPREGPQRHAGLFQGAGADGQGLRRGGLAQDRRCGALRRGGQSCGRPAVRRPRGGELQADARARG